jgi:hypothetical protein
LRSPFHYFLSRTDSGFFDPGIFAVAKFLEAGVSAAEQEVVFVFVNNDHVANGNRGATFRLDAIAPNGQNGFGIQPGHSYNIRNLIGADPQALIWGADVLGSTLIANGIGVLLNGSASAGEQAQYLKLVDRTVGEPPDADGDGLPDAFDNDSDNDGLPDDWERAHGLDDSLATGDHGAEGDLDEDGVSNHEEWVAGTHPNDEQSFLRIEDLTSDAGGREVAWDSVSGRNYRLQKAQAPGGAWSNLLHFTAPGGPLGILDPAADPQAIYRVTVGE